MYMKNKHDKLSSPTNPNGLFEAFISGSIVEDVPDVHDRLTLAVADLKSFLVETAGLDPDMSEVVAARALQEFMGASGLPVDQTQVESIIRNGSELSSVTAVDRAVDEILG